MVVLRFLVIQSGKATSADYIIDAGSPFLNFQDPLRIAVQSVPPSINNFPMQHANASVMETIALV
jgi:hypothetical protein